MFFIRFYFCCLMLCAHMTVWGWSPATKSKWALRMTCGASILSFRHVGPGGGAHFLPRWSLGRKHLCPLSHLRSLILFYFQSAYTAIDVLMVFLYLCAFGWLPPSRFLSPHLPAFHSHLWPSMGVFSPPLISSRMSYCSPHVAPLKPPLPFFLQPSLVFKSLYIRSRTHED